MLHFTDKAELLEEVAGRGFDAMSDDFNAAVSKHDLGSIEGITVLGQAYVRFAAERTNLFRTMFSDRPHGKTYETPEELEGKDCFMILLNSVAAFLAKNGISAEETLDVSLPLWTIVHGTASLLIDHNFQRMAPNSDPNQMIAMATRYYLDGLVAEKSD